MAIIINTELLAAKIIEIKNTVNELEQKFNEVNTVYDSITKEIWESPTKDKLDEKYVIFKNNYIAIVEKLNKDIEFLNNVIKTYEQKEQMIAANTDKLSIE